MKKYNMVQTEKQQKYWHYHQVKVINVNIQRAKKYHLLIKVELYSKLILLILHQAFGKQMETVKEQGKTS